MGDDGDVARSDDGPKQFGTTSIGAHRRQRWEGVLVERFGVVDNVSPHTLRRDARKAVLRAVRLSADDLETLLLLNGHHGRSGSDRVPSEMVVEARESVEFRMNGLAQSHSTHRRSDVRSDNDELLARVRRDEP